MAKLKIYGIPRSRAFRTMWLAAELGLGRHSAGPAAACLS